MNFTSFFTGNSTAKNNNLINDSKHHYYIGCVINDEILIEKLKVIRKKLINKYDIQELHFPNLVSSNLIYLGYFNLSIAKLYMDKIIRFLVDSVVQKYEKLECKLTNFKLIYDQTYYKIMIQLEDDNNHLKKIINFLQKRGVEPVYGNKKYERKASMDMLYFKKSEKIEVQKKKFGKKFKLMGIDLPIDKFLFDELVLIQGTPLITRRGTPSIHAIMY